MSTLNETRVAQLDDHARPDLREALWNDGEVGTIESIQVSTERITRLRGILFDIDPDLLREGPIIERVPGSPRELYAEVIRPVLDRHPVLTKAEVRSSGRGLHGILRFGEPIDLTSHGEQQRWAGIVQVVQAALPIDPDQPGITATTRAIGSTNSKNGATVEQITPGEGCDA